MKKRMNEGRGDLGERDEDEIAKVKPRVRDGQKRRIGLLLAKKEQVEIDSAGLFLRFISAAEKIFDAKQASHHLRWGHGLRTYFRHHI